MTAPPIICPDPECGETVEYWNVHCRCGQFLGFPNQRAAAAERVELEKLYDASRLDAEARKVALLLGKLEELAERCLPVIAMSFEACDDILRPGKYRNYHQRVDSGERDPASAQNHSDREMVGARLFPMYHQHIHYAALSPDGRGLESYGPIAVCWSVTAAYLGRRISVLDENSFILYERFGLGRLGATLPPGHQAVWDDRAKLVAAKLAEHLTPATKEANLPRMLLPAGKTRKDDIFFEIVLYADTGIDTVDVSRVTVQSATKTDGERTRLELVRAMCAARGDIEWNE